MNEGSGISNFTGSMLGEGRIYGVVAGVVIKNDSANDADKPGPGRVKVKVPLIGMPESNWARVASWMAGKDRGAFFLPEVDDEVLVMFENGDVNRPYVIGSLWNGKDTPPETNKDGKNNLRVFKSRSGHLLEFADTKGEERITITSAKGHVIRLDDKSGAERIEIKDKSGSNSVLIDAKANKVSIVSSKDIEISAPSGKLSLAAKTVELKSSADTTISASAGMNVKALASMTIKGATVNIN
ncbi:phage baseplate assembly protein V [Paenibacillus macerans]|uniref:phage baseplate assembly protein V n=1 Tax=Paenibacillus macerans TaxID=44252 RepID=UPI00203EB921|nr:phage baseplate assembly protein V [Paenibacillus macerans]MCM3702374.1 phage baseplate assembly protein V [Paenibacillus macerans]